MRKGTGGSVRREMREQPNECQFCDRQGEWTTPPQLGRRDEGQLLNEEEIDKQRRNCERMKKREREGGPVCFFLW